MDLRRNPEMGWNLLFGVSLIAIVLLGIFGFAKPAEPAEMLKHRSDRAASSSAIKDSNAESDKALTAIHLKTWTQSAEGLGPQLMQQLNHMADDHHVALSNFRSGHTTEVAALDEVPFIATLDGSFTDVIAFLGAIEKTDSKLAVNLLQITTSDKGSGKVTATIGLVAFLVKEGI